MSCLYFRAMDDDSRKKRTEFSVISSVLSATDIAVFIGDTYALASPATCRLLKAGINHTYRIDSGNERFVFRIYSYNWRTKQEITEELALLQRLTEHDISVSYPVADRSGQLIQDIQAPEGLRFAVLFSFAEGRKVLNYSREVHYKAGELMARIHRLTKDVVQHRTHYTPDVLLNQSLGRIRERFPDDTDELRFLTDTRPLLEAELLQADEAMLRKGIVHLDIWFDNLNISDKDEITLFDFDFCGNGWLCLDIAYYILQLHSTEKDETELTEKTAAFYKGYESIEHISEEERRLIPALGVSLYYFYLGVQCIRFDNWSNTFLNEVYFKRFITVLIKGYYDKNKLNQRSD